MKALSQDALKRMALSHGGKLEVDGKPVNTARLQVVGAPKTPEKAAYMPAVPKAEPIPTMQHMPDPALREALLSIDQYAASNFLLNEANVKLMESVKETLRQATAKEPEKRPVKWVFNVKRDAQGLMEQITASAVFK